MKTETITPTTTEEVLEAIGREVEAAAARVHQDGRMHLADLMRLGADKTEQESGWGRGARACAWSATGLAGAAFGIVK